MQPSVKISASPITSSDPQPGRPDCVAVGTVKLSCLTALSPDESTTLTPTLCGPAPKAYCATGSVPVLVRKSPSPLRSQS